MSHAASILAHQEVLSRIAYAKPLAAVNREKLDTYPRRILFAECLMAEASALGAHRLLHEREHSFEQLVQEQAELAASLKLRVIK